MNKAAFKELLQRYLANNCSDVERKLVEGFYDLLGEDQDVGIENLAILEDKMWDRIKDETHLHKKDSTEDIIKFLPLKPWYRKSVWRVAASILVLLGVGFTWVQFQSFKQNYSEDRVLASQNTITNTTQIPMDVMLEDSTKVSLYPESQLNISLAFSKHNKREVFLTGEALFDVSKNPEKPFLVQTGDLITRVIGTSFKITSNSHDDNIEVAVLSGKVSVYNNDVQKKQEKKNNGVVLTPNQKVIYHLENKQFVMSVVDEPLLLSIGKTNDSLPTTFIYDETPIEEVLQQLEKNYGIQIEVIENERFFDCPLTANLSEQSLFNKLEMICTSLNATYEVKGTTILISGRGCH